MKHVPFLDGGKNKTYNLSRWGRIVPCGISCFSMTLAELADRLGIQPRQIRFMIAEGILPPAAKTGRSADAYEEAHVVKGQRYLALYRMGMKPGSIKVLMAFDDAVPILQEQGIELRIDPQMAPQELDVEAILRAVEQALRTYKNEE